MLAYMASARAAPNNGMHPTPHQSAPLIHVAQGRGWRLGVRRLKMMSCNL